MSETTSNAANPTSSVHSAYQANTYLFGGNAPYVEELYESYLDHPGSVPDKWRAYFDQLQHMPATDGRESTRDQAHAPIV